MQRTNMQTTIIVMTYQYSYRYRSFQTIKLAKAIDLICFFYAHMVKHCTNFRYLYFHLSRKLLIKLLLYYVRWM